MTWKIVYKKSIKKDLKQLSPEVKSIIEQVINEKLKVDPIKFGTPLRKTLKGLFKLRIGNYRLVYSIQKQTITVFVIKIAHRRDVYKKV